MDKDQFEILEGKLDELNKQKEVLDNVLIRVKKIEDALAGDGMKGEQGLMGVVKQMLEDIYGKGTLEERKNSIKSRMSAVEDSNKTMKDERNKIIWWASGWACGAGLIGGLVVKAVWH